MVSKWRVNYQFFEYHKSFQDFNYPWAGHIYFAYDYLKNVRPRRIVELGTFMGTSLFSFAQASKDTQDYLPEIFAIDTWLGDENTGFYGEDVYQSVVKIIKDYYREESIRLVRDTFDNALSLIEDESVDLLHIDGLHTYESVRHDFETWLPKMSEDGTIFFHDIQIAHYGVWKLWAELKKEFASKAKFFEFYHSCGLGIMYLGKTYFDLTAEDVGYYRNRYHSNKEIFKLVQDQIKSKDKKIFELESKVEKNTELSQINTLLNQTKQELEELKRKDKSSKQFFDILYQIYQNLNNDINDLFSSKRWRYSTKFTNLAKKLLLKSSKPSLIQTNLLKSLSRTKQIFRDIKTSSLKKEIITIDKKIDVIVTVHNALEYLKSCLESLIKTSRLVNKIIIIDDGSDTETKEFLENFSSINQDKVILARNDRALGYTHAINQGLELSTEEYFVLLNSDTVVPVNWIERLLEVALSDSSVGIVGPLSNAASYQSVPDIIDAETGTWKINTLPDGHNLDTFDKLVFEVSLKEFPNVNFVNGFCFLVKKDVVNKIGKFDEESFPMGYGEEDDFCIRAREAGYKLAIADHLFVFHSKTKSFSSEERKKIVEISGRKNLEKYGEENMARWQKEMRNHPQLAEIRLRISNSIKSNIAVHRYPKIVFLLPISAGGGGVYSVVQEVNEMRRMNVDAKILIRNKHLPEYMYYFGRSTDFEDIFISYSKVTEIEPLLFDSQIIVATIYSSVGILKQIVDSNSKVIPAYYIQDYEPWFHEEGTIEYLDAFNSYNMIPNMVCFAKTDWLVETVGRKHNIKVHKVSPSLDHYAYKVDLKEWNKSADKINVTAMVRPETPRRGAKLTMNVLKKIAEKFTNIEVNIFGCENSTLERFGLPIDFEFKNHGVIRKEEVGNLLCKSDIFVDFSLYQAFGRTGIEAMACGCAVILPKEGGVYEYAIDGYNSLIIDSNSQEQCIEALYKLIEDPNLMLEIRMNALDTVTKFSTVGAAKSELNLFFKELLKNNIETKI